MLKTIKPCCIAGCPNKNCGKKDRCSTHYKAWKRENIPGFIEAEKAAWTKANRSSKAKIAHQKHRNKVSEVQPIQSTKYVTSKDLYPVMLTVDEITRMSEVSRGAWRTLLNNMVEDEMIHSWLYDSSTNVVTLLLYKDQELAFAVGFNQMPEGVLERGTSVPDSMGSRGKEND